MKKKHLLLLLAVALVLGLAGIYFKISQSAGWNDSKTDRTIFQNLAVNDITNIQVRSTPANVTLEKKGDAWGLVEREDYPADFTKIQDLIKMLWGLKAGQEMQVGPSQLARLKLVAPGQGSESGTEISLKGDKDKDIAFFIIEPVSVGSWLDKVFITPGEVAEIDQAPWSNNPGWKLIRKEAKAEWQLEEVQ